MALIIRWLSYLSCCLLLVACVTNQTNSFDKYAAAEARFNLGLNYLEYNQLEQAKKNFDKAMEYAPDTSLPYLGLAGYYHKIAENQKAEQYYLKALEYKNTSGFAANNYATFLCEQNRFSEANVRFEQALKAENYYHQEELYTNIINCALKEKNSIRAKQYIDKLAQYNLTKADYFKKIIEN